MADLSKLRIFFVFSALILYSCENERNDVIPDVYVDFTMDLEDYPALTTTLGAVTVGKNDLRIPKREYAGGFNGNGIIIINTSDEYIPFYAYDRTCPHDYSIDQSSIKVNLDFVQAICPKCSTVYELAGGGYPISGPGRYQLKNYKTQYIDRFLRVWNY